MLLPEFNRIFATVFSEKLSEMSFAYSAYFSNFIKGYICIILYKLNTFVNIFIFVAYNFFSLLLTGYTNKLINGRCNN